MADLERSGSEHPAKLHWDIQTPPKGGRGRRSGPEADRHANSRTHTQRRGSPEPPCHHGHSDPGGGSRKSPRPRTPGQGCALWPPCPGVSPEANTPSMTEPRTPPWLEQSLPSFEEVGLSRLQKTPSARPPSPRSSPASRPQPAASPSADGRGAPGAAAAPSRAWPGRAPAPAALQLARPAPARARPGPGPAAPSSALSAPGSRRHTA